MNRAPKFFMPKARDEAMAEEEWKKLRDRYGTTDQRIYSLTWMHKGTWHEAEVGRPIKNFPEPAGMVIAIIRGHWCFMVFTMFRGILASGPIMVGDDEHEDHIEFSIDAA